MWRVGLSLVAAIAIPSTALAAPEAFAHKAKVIASRDTIEIFGLPTTDAAGNVKYFDTTINLKLNANGKPRRAKLTAVPSPAVDALDFVPGDYADENVSCELTTAPFGGQTEVVLHCTTGSVTAEVVVYTGPVASTPFASTLLDQGVDEVPGTEQFAWGLVTNSGVNGFGGCLRNGDILSARQLGDTVVLVDYFSNPLRPNCSLSLFRIEP